MKVFVINNTSKKVVIFDKSSDVKATLEPWLVTGNTVNETCCALVEGESNVRSVFAWCKSRVGLLYAFDDEARELLTKEFKDSEVTPEFVLKGTILEGESFLELTLVESFDFFPKMLRLNQELLTTDNEVQIMGMTSTGSVSEVTKLIESEVDVILAVLSEGNDSQDVSFEASFKFNLK